ncbi:MAG: alpha/beta hydrolase [Chlorobiaceae bacterium]|nr:alpha/beta hydrolase [Chlorobiaceae bacterium]NTV60080.1 alpha/beta hydrolase [Chlorobiaceae bacterium]
MTQFHQPTGSENGACQVQAGDITMSCRVIGSGHPLLLIMGYGSTMNLWEPQLLERFAERYKVIVFDNRGVGGSEAGVQPFSISQFAEDSSALLHALGVGQAHVLGWSMGSLVAQELALLYPARVSRLVLHAAHCDAKMFPPSPEVLARLTDPSGTPEERGMRYISVLFPESWLRDNGLRLKEIFFRPMGPVPEESIGMQAEAIDSWEGSAGRLDKIACPTLLVAGAEDNLVPPENSRYMAGKIPGSQLTVIENGGHGLMFQFPGIFSDIVAGFLG